MRQYEELCNAFGRHLLNILDLLPSVLQLKIVGPFNIRLAKLPKPALPIPRSYFGRNVFHFGCWHASPAYPNTRSSVSWA